MIIWLIVYCAIITLAYLYTILQFQKFIKSKRDLHAQNKSWDLQFCVFLILVNYSAIMYLVYSMAYSLEPLRYFYLNFITVPIAILWIFILISSYFYHKRREKIRKPKDRKKFNKLAVDVRRKIAHIAFYIIIWVGLFIYMEVVIVEPPSDIGEFLIGMWEYNPSNPGEPFRFFQLMSNPAQFNLIGYSHMLLVLIFVISHYCFIIFEMVRHSNKLWSPTNLLVLDILREEEIDHLATYFQFFLSITLSSIILPPILTFAVITVTLFGDLLASQVGMRWGKYHLPLNGKKTWSGLFAGTIGSYLLTAILIGPIWAFFCASIFFLTDFLTPKPVPISDNLLNPLLLTFTFVILNLCGIPYEFPMFLVP